MKRLSYIGGGTPGRDHYYFNTEDIDNPLNRAPANGIGDGFLNPFNLTIAQAHKWMWLVRIWHFNLEAEYTYYTINPSPPPTYNSHSGHASLSFDLTYHVNAYPAGGDDYFIVPQNEIFKVLPEYEFGVSGAVLKDQSVVFGTSAPPSLEPTFENVSASLSEVTGISDGGTVIACAFEAVFFYQMFWKTPNMILPDCDVAGSVASTGATITSQYNEPDHGSYTVYVGQLNVDTQSCPIHTTPAGADTNNFTAFTISVTPKKYWPYANSQGQPVYDETTGAQLVDPFS